MMRGDYTLPTFSGGLNQSTSPHLLKDAELWACKNFLPASDIKTDLEKVKMRNKDMIRLNATGVMSYGTAFTYNNTTGVVSSITFSDGSIHYVDVGDNFRVGATYHPITAVSRANGTFTVSAGLGLSSTGFSIYNDGFSRADDQLWANNLLSFGTWSAAEKYHPAFDNIDGVYYFANNVYSIKDDGAASSAGTPYAAPFYPTAGTATCKIGILIREPIDVTTSIGLWVRILAKRVGAYDAAKHVFSASLTSVTGGISATLTTPSVTKSLSTTLYEPLEICFLASSSDSRIMPGEYYVTLSNTASDVNQHYILAMGGSSYNLYGYAILDGSTDACMPLSEVTVYKKKGTNSNTSAQSDVVVSANTVNREQIEVVSGTTTKPNADAWVLTDGNSGFVIRDMMDYYSSWTTGDKRLAGTLFNAWSNDAYPAAAFGTGLKFFAERNSSVFYNNYLVAATKFGLAAANLKEFVNSAFTDVYIPDIGSRDDATYSTYTGFSLTGTAYTYTSATGVVSAITFAAGKSIYDVAAGDTFTDDSTGASSTVVSVSYGTPSFTIETGAASSFNGGNFTITKHTDVFQPDVKALTVATINPGRVFIAIGNSIKWSGGTTAATTGTFTNFSPFAEIAFGDGADEIEQLAFMNGLILIFTRKGKLYWVSGEPPTDPTYGYGTLRADGGVYVGRVAHIANTGQAAIYFSTRDRYEHAHKVWRIDSGSLMPQEITGKLGSLRIESISWEHADSQLWIYSKRHVVRAYNTTASDDSTIRYIYDDGTTGTSDAPQGGTSYVLDTELNAWFAVEHPLATEDDSLQPVPFVHGKTCWQVGASITAPLTTNAYGYYCRTQVAGDDGMICVFTDANTNEPVNSSTRALSSTASLTTKLLRFGDMIKRNRAEGQILQLVLDAYLTSGTTCTAYWVDQDGTETSIGTFTGAGAFSDTDIDRFIAGLDPMDRTAQCAIKLSITGAYHDRIRSLGFTYNAFPVAGFTS